jgi:hypothetical protein
MKDQHAASKPPRAQNQNEEFNRHKTPGFLPSLCLSKKVGYQVLLADLQDAGMSTGPTVAEDEDFEDEDEDYE